MTLPFPSELISIAVGLVSLLLLIYFAFRYRGRPTISDDAIWLTEEEFGYIERDVKFLKDVIVVADIVEKPERHIADAVVDNFMEKVRYQFVVSRDNYSYCDEHLRPWYVAAIRYAAGLAGSQIRDDEELVHFHALSYNRHDYPYVFFRFTPPGGETKIMAYRGNERGKGIASEYRRVEPGVAYTVLAATLADAHAAAPPEIEPLLSLPVPEPEQYTDKPSNNVIEFRGKGYLRIGDDGRVENG